MKPILEIKGVSKKYSIRGQQKPYLSLREDLFSFLKPSSRKEEFWALQDVSFNVMPGDTIGIIGKNGAGKSTLLKILSKITPPTSGSITCRGRIASLLEVGTGFHPELSGRENIFLNGSILGMKRVEIQKQFDAIVDFAGVEKFIETPLKHYSSGMQLRLAFAVAAFLEPEILVIDEVLAVGDAEFQKKCLSKMEDVSRSGRTILFVSHNMAAVKELCKRGVFLSKGKTAADGSIDEAIKRYTEELAELSHFQNGQLFIKEKSIHKLELFHKEKPADFIPSGGDLKLKVHFKTNRQLNYPVLGLVIRDLTGTPLMAINNKHYSGNLINNTIQSGAFEINFPQLHLMYGDYLVDLYLGNEHSDFEVLKECFVLRIDKTDHKAPESPSLELNKIFYKQVNWKMIPGE
ncbi:MAG: ABC transporter ATP-binding protein [Bacteroidia bacterium]|nr:ABC transporter ATP-binding protein [Bacteroidia bacterium]